MLQSLGIQRHADAVVPDDLDQIATNAPEDIEIAGMRVAAERYRLIMTHDWNDEIIERLRRKIR